MKTNFSDKVDAVAACYVENRRHYGSHDKAEDICYKLAANQNIDSYELREGIKKGEGEKVFDGH